MLVIKNRQQIIQRDQVPLDNVGPCEKIIHLVRRSLYCIKISFLFNKIKVECID